MFTKRLFSTNVQKFRKQLTSWKLSQSSTQVKIAKPVCRILIPTLICVAKTAPKSSIPEVMSEEMTLDIVLQNSDQLFDENHYQEVHDLLEKYSDQSLSEIKWRKARALYFIAKTVNDKTERARLIREAYALLKSALEINENNFAIHKWMSIILDSYSELDGLKSRLTQLENVKKHMLRAIELNPTDPTSWYLLGSFEYGLAELPWIQRKIVSALFASPPTGSFEKALEYFEKAEKIKEGFYSMNWLMLGKCYLVLNDKERAKTYLNKASNCRALNEEDKNCKEEAAKMLKKL